MASYDFSPRSNRYGQSGRYFGQADPRKYQHWRERNNRIQAFDQRRVEVIRKSVAATREETFRLDRAFAGEIFKGKLQKLRQSVKLGREERRNASARGFKAWADMRQEREWIKADRDLNRYRYNKLNALSTVLSYGEVANAEDKMARNLEARAKRRANGARFRAERAAGMTEQYLSWQNKRRLRRNGTLKEIRAENQKRQEMVKRSIGRYQEIEMELGTNYNGSAADKAILRAKIDKKHMQKQKELAQLKRVESEILTGQHESLRPARAELMKAKKSLQIAKLEKQKGILTDKLRDLRQAADKWTDNTPNGNITKEKLDRRVAVMALALRKTQSYINRLMGQRDAAEK